MNKEQKLKLIDGRELKNINMYDNNLIHSKKYNDRDMYFKISGVVYKSIPSDELKINEIYANLLIRNNYHLQINDTVVLHEHKIDNKYIAKLKINVFDLNEFSKQTDTVVLNEIELRNKFKQKFKTKVRDKKNINELKELGWKVITIWQCEIKNIEVRTKRLEKLVDELVD